MQQIKDYKLIYHLGREAIVFDIDRHKKTATMLIGTEKKKIGWIDDKPMEICGELDCPHCGGVII